MAVFFMIETSLNEYIRCFLEYLKFEKRYSQKTIISYKTDLSQFDLFLGEKYLDLKFQKSDNLDQKNSGSLLHIGEITSAIIKSWLVDLKKNKLEARSINRKISAVKSFFRYLLKQGQIKKNPASAVHVLKTPKRLPNFVQEDQIPEIMNLPIEENDLSWKNITENLLIELLYVCGLRVSELVELKESQLDEQRSLIKVLGKGNKERLIPLHIEMIEKLKLYISAKRRIFDTSDASKMLFVNGLGRKLNAQYAYRAVKGRLKDVRDLSKKSPHVMRHTFATHLANNGADLNAIKELLGHSSLAATQIYTHNTIEKLRELHQKAHPRG